MRRSMERFKTVQGIATWRRYPRLTAAVAVYVKTSTKRPIFANFAKILADAKEWVDGIIEGNKTRLWLQQGGFVTIHRATREHRLLYLATLGQLKEEIHEHEQERLRATGPGSTGVRTHTHG